MVVCLQMDPLGLLLFGYTLIVCSILWQQRLASWFFLVGVVAFLFLTVIYLLEVYIPYDKFGLDIDFAFDLALKFFYAGGIGLLVKRRRYTILAIIAGLCVLVLFAAWFPVAP